MLLPGDADNLSAKFGAVNRTSIGIVALVLVAGAFFWSALSGDVYEITSPTSLHLHTVLRKLYSIVAFAVVSYLSGRLARSRSRAQIFWISVLAGANFSALIEIVQAFISSESLKWHLIDVACGAIGGAIGGLIAAAPWTRRS